MAEHPAIPESGTIAYAGPPLGEEVREVLAGAGYVLADLPSGGELPSSAAGFCFNEAWGTGPLREQAAAAGAVCFTDLALLSHLRAHLHQPRKHRILITGSAGKTVTAALTEQMLSRAKGSAVVVEQEAGYLSALGRKEGVLILTAAPSQVATAGRAGFHAAAVLNLTEEAGRPVAEETKRACAGALTAAGVAILGTDDSGAQAVLMAARRISGSSARGVVTVSGGSTLSGGFFAIDRVLYAARMGRTRRAASFAEAPNLLGDHFGQSAAAAAALASSFGVIDDQIGDVLKGFQGLPGRFECVASGERIVFVDDRAAVTPNSAAASIAACPDVFWIGHSAAPLPKRGRAALKGSFRLLGENGEGPPLDHVTTFKDAEEAVSAAIAAAAELLARQPDAAPVLLFAPGAPGFAGAAETFVTLARKAAGGEGRLHA